MSENYKPGDVAVIRYTNGTEGRVMRTTDPTYPWADTGNARYEDGIGLRPLVVLDPEDAEQVERLLRAQWREFGNEHRFDDGTVAERVARVQDALRSLVRPPKPAEPTGLGAVVEDADGTRYVLAGEGVCPWIKYDDHATSHYYADIDAVRVLSEGVEVDR